MRHLRLSVARRFLHPVLPVVRRREHMTEPDERKGMPSASAFGRYLLCKGSYQLEQEARALGQVAHIGGKDAARGNRIHAWLADPNSIELAPNEQADADDLHDRAGDQVRRIFDGAPVQCLAEKRLWMRTNRSSLSVSARFDSVTYNDTICLVQNYKSGWKEPDPVRLNAQMKVEAVLVAMHMPKTIERFIIQLVTMPFGVLESEFKWAELRDMYNWIVGILVELENERAPVTPHPDACPKCPAQLICQACKDLIGPLTKLRASAIGNDPKRLAESLDAIQIVRSYLDEFWAYCENGLTEGTLKIDGYAMVPGTERREWKDLETAAHRLFMESGAKESDFTKIKTHTVAAYQKLYARLHGKRPEEVREAFDKLMDGLVETKQNKASLKRVKGESLVRSLE
jgi:Protein of unknown function (DUF2800)